MQSTAKSVTSYQSNSNFNSGKWTQEEDDTLNKLIEKYGTKRWKDISEKMLSRSPVQCLHRWTKILKPGLKKGSWTIEEDKKLLEWIKTQGPIKWSHCSELIKGRSGKQCRERWFNTLNPNLKKGNWTPYEDFNIFHQFKLNGSKWSKISLFLPGRTENSIKNRFYSTLRRIGCDLFKSSSMPMNQFNNGNTMTCNSINSMNNLLTYFDIAYQEKKKAYEQYCDMMSNESIQKSQMKKEEDDYEGEAEDREDNNKDEAQVHRDDIELNRDEDDKENLIKLPKEPFHSNNNSFEDNTNKIDYLMAKETNRLDKDIMNYSSCFDLPINESEIDKAQFNLNKLMSRYINSTDRGTSIKADKDTIAFYNQLNELEEYLLRAKKKLFQAIYSRETNDKMEEYYNDSKEEGERYYSFQFEKSI